jgi:hypothetical protein
MAFRQTGLCRLITLMLTLCMLMCAASSALSESEMTEEQMNEVFFGFSFARPMRSLQNFSGFQIHNQVIP